MCVLHEHFVILNLRLLYFWKNLFESVLLLTQNSLFEFASDFRGGFVLPGALFSSLGRLSTQDSLLEFSLLLRDNFESVSLGNVQQLEGVSDDSEFDFSVQRRVDRKGRRMIDFQQPRLQLVVQQNVEA